MQTAFVGCGAALVASEIIARRIIKVVVARPRPDYVGMQCHAVHCYGFVSNHATTIFSFAVFLTLYDRKNAFWSFPLALIVCFSRIYLGVHYPLDIIGGAIVGTVIGFGVRWCQLYFGNRKTAKS